MWTSENWVGLLGSSSDAHLHHLQLLLPNLTSTAVGGPLNRHVRRVHFGFTLLSSLASSLLVQPGSRLLIKLLYRDLLQSLLLLFGRASRDMLLLDQRPPFWWLRLVLKENLCGIGKPEFLGLDGLCPHPTLNSPQSSCNVSVVHLVCIAWGFGRLSRCLWTGGMGFINCTSGFGQY